MPLPKVTMATSHAVLGELMGRDGGTSVQALLERMKKSNPCVARFIHQLANRHKDTAEVYAAALVVYRLMESQEEADRMTEEFLWPEPEKAGEPQVSAPELDRS